MGYIKLDSSAFLHNINQIAKKSGSAENIIAVLKDNAYGHGLKEISDLAKKGGIKRVAVRNLQEADIAKDFESVLILREIPTQKTPFVLTINSLETLKEIPNFSKVALKVDTGMHRNGIEIGSINRAYEIIYEKNLILDSIFTHFRSSDELSSELFWQMKNFEEVKIITKNLNKKYNYKNVFYHSANSSAIFRLKKIEDDFVRAGIALYGYLQSDEIFETPDLKPVLSLWGEKISSRVVKKGGKIGYGGVFEAKNEMVVSNYDIGYGDGFFRYDGNGELETACKKQITGRISMDSFSCRGEEEEVCLLDDALKIANFFGTISYDVLVKLSSTIPKKII